MDHRPMDIKYNTIKLLEENLCYLGFGNEFVDTSKAQSMGKKTDKVHFIKNFCSVNDTVKRMKRQATKCEKPSANTYQIKDWYSKQRKKLLELISKKTNNSIK